MLFERFEEDGLAQHSYAVGCSEKGEIAIVDPRRDIDLYLNFAEENDVKIAHVLETHIHADFASGAKELAEKTGAVLWVSGYDKDEEYEVSFSHRDLFEGDKVQIGDVRIEVLHTPGHTPEHLSFLVFDEARSSKEPMLMLTGDFLFVGSLGRPDLLGEDEKRKLAESLYESVTQKLKDLPEGLEIHPGHGEGSMCGSGMGGRPMTTLGYERCANPYLDEDLSCEEFKEKILSDVPPFPDYYKRMKRFNTEGPTILDGLPGEKPMDLSRFKELVDEGDHVVIDLRTPKAFSSGHIPNSFGIGVGQNLSTWASWVVPYDKPILLLPDSKENVSDAIRALVRVGLDNVVGYLDGTMDDWKSAQYPVDQVSFITPEELYALLNTDSDVKVLDVRTDDEWEDGHIADAVHIMGGKLPEHVDELSKEGVKWAVICGSGYRSTVAVSVLERAGFDNLLNVGGGMGAWNEKNLPTHDDEGVLA